MNGSPLTPESVSMIIPAHRDGPMLQACLEAVSRLDPPPLEVIVAVDGSGEEVVATSRRFGFKVLPLPDAPGVSATRNAGAAMATGDILAFLDSDVEPRPDFVRQAVAILKDHPGAKAAFGSYDARPAAPGVVSRYRNLLHHHTHQRASREAQTFWAACGVCEARVFREVGGYDERFSSPSIEDIELGYRLRKAGHRIVLDPGWQIRHLKKWRLRDLFITDVMLRAYPWTLLLLHRGRMENNLNIDTRSRMSALSCLVALVAIPLSFLASSWLLVTAFFLGIVIFLNRRFYGFLAGSEGWRFAIMAIPLHLLYFMAALTGYLMGVFVFQLEQFQKKTAVNLSA